MLNRQAAGDGVLRISTEKGVSPILDELAPRAADSQRFLRAAWFRGSVNGSPAETLVSSRACGEPFAALPIVSRRMGPLSIREVPGCYWPYRSFPIAADASVDEIRSLLDSPITAQTLGPAWRIGPIYSDDPTAKALVAACEDGGWHLLRRSLGTCYMIDVKRLRSEGPWPSVKTLRKNRWCEKRLAEMGELEFSTISGPDWSEEVVDTLAVIEKESWVGTSGSKDAKFLNSDHRRIWSQALQDPSIATMLNASLLRIGGAPAAFTFSIQSGSVRHYIANSYSERFTQFSAGRVLLYRDFQQAADDGIEMIGWGAGDPGYKTEMGAEPGPEINDYLIVRGRLLSMAARAIWARGA